MKKKYSPHSQNVEVQLVSSIFKEIISESDTEEALSVVLIIISCHSGKQLERR
jgi:hypothetical protein